MNKPAKIIGAVAIIALVSVISMFAFRLCPPSGPWPMPPWCSYNSVQEYEYKDLGYINGQPEGNGSFELGIGTFDVWGNPHLWIDLGDITTKNIDTTMQRLNAIGSTVYMLTDFALFHNNGTITVPTPEDSPGTYNIRQDELDRLVSKAKDNNQQTIILMLNLVEMKSDIEGAGQAFKKNNDIGNEIAIEIARKQFEEGSGLSDSQTIGQYSSEQRDALLEQWKRFVLYEARKAEKAGITHLIINPRHVYLESVLDRSYLKEKYKEIIAETRKHFSGRIGYWGPLDTIGLTAPDNIDFMLIDFDASWGAASQIFHDVPKDIRAMQSGFDNYFGLEQWSGINGKELYLLITIPSIEHGLSRGWIPPSELTKDAVVDYEEQAMAYEALFRSLSSKNPGIRGVISYGYWWTDSLFPETKVLRNDLMHSIRSKDAEHVFRRWSSGAYHR